MQLEIFLHEFTDFLYVENIFLIINIILYIVGNLQKKRKVDGNAISLSGGYSG